MGGTLQSTVVGGASGALFGEIGDYSGSLAGGDTSSAFADGGIGRAGLHAFGGGMMSVAEGGNFGSGAMAAGFSELSGPMTSGLGPVGDGVSRMVIGGTASVIGGGKFKNGAITAAYGYLFNDCSDVAGGCWRAYKDAASMAMDWARGTGPDTRVFGPGSIQVTDMMDAPGVNGARDLFYQKNASALASGNYDALDPVTNYSAKFGLYDFLTTSSPTQQFVGSYRVDVLSVNQGADLMFVATNTSSFKSFGYGITPAWERSTFAPGGNMRQTYWWTEPRRK